MKQYTTPKQTAKLIELGFEKPKSISGYYQRGPYEYDAETNTKMVVYDDTQYPIYAYSIGELIEMLPLHIFPNKVCFDLKILANQNWWVVEYTNLFYDEFHCFCSKELIDALFDMIVILKEEGVI